MPEVTKPVILDETGQEFNRKLEPLPDGIQAVIEALDRLDIIYYVENN